MSFTATDEMLDKIINMSMEELNNYIDILKNETKTFKLNRRNSTIQSIPVDVWYKQDKEEARTLLEECVNGILSELNLDIDGIPDVMRQQLIQTAVCFMLATCLDKQSGEENTRMLCFDFKDDSFICYKKVV